MPVHEVPETRVVGSLVAHFRVRCHGLGNLLDVGLGAARVVVEVVEGQKAVLVGIHDDVAQSELLLRVIDGQLARVHHGKHFLDGVRYGLAAVLGCFLVGVAGGGLHCPYDFCNLVPYEFTHVEVAQVMALRAVDGGHLVCRNRAAAPHELGRGSGVGAHDDAGAVERGRMPVEVDDGRARDTYALFAGNAHPRVKLVRRYFEQVEREAAQRRRRESHGVAHGGNHVAQFCLDEHERPLVRGRRLDVCRRDEVGVLSVGIAAAEHEQARVLAVVYNALAER